MDLARARTALDALTLPSWVEDRVVEADVDRDGEPFVRVWLDVGGEFDYDDHRTEARDAVERAETCVQDALDEAHWVVVSLRSPIAETD